MRGVCRDFVQCPYVIRERVLKTDIFQGVSPICVLYLVLQRKKGNFTHEKKINETKR